MAKQRGPVASTFSGRVGNVVGAKIKGGEYVTRSYQPAVKNPNTLRQRTSRMRMTIASRLAAGLAAAIQSGYAFSTNGTKMYPRNMFVAEVVKMNGNGSLVVVGGQSELDYGTLRVSRRNGINELPIAGTLGVATAGKLVVPITVPQITDILPDGKMGVVVCAYEPDGNASLIGFEQIDGGSTANVELTVPSSWSGLTVHVFAFLKWVPTTGNDVQTDAEPWKYPAQTGDTVYCGTANLT